QTNNQRKFQYAVMNGLGTGILIVFLAGIGMCLWPFNFALGLLFIFSLPLAPLLGSLIGYRAGKRQTEVVPLRGYCARQGTVAICFRRAEYTQQMLAAMTARVRDEAVRGQ